MPEVYVATGKEAYNNTIEVLKAAGSSFIENLRSPLIIKPNLVIDTKNEGATTDPYVVKAVYDHITEKTKIDHIIVADGSGGNTKTAFERFGYNLVFEKTDVELRDLNKDKPVWIDIIDPLTDLPKKLPIAESVLNARYLISCAMPKTHDHGIASLGLKNLVGVVPGTKWKKTLHGGNYPDNMTDYEFERSINGFHKNLFSIYKKVHIDFTIIDGTRGMEGDGPVSGKLKKGSFGLGGADPVAVDAIGAYLMGFDPYEIGYMYLSEKAGLGVADISKITVVPAEALKLRRKYKPHRRYSLMHYRP